MAQSTEEFYRIQKLPPYVFAVINEMRARARAAQQDVIDLGMGNPDGATPRVVVGKMVEAVRNARNHRYSASRGIPRLREEITRRYRTNYGVELDPETEAIVTIGAKDALASAAARTISALCCPQAIRTMRRASRIVFTPIVIARRGVFSSPPNSSDALRPVIESRFTIRVRDRRALPCSLNPMWPVRPIPQIWKPIPPAACIFFSYSAQWASSAAAGTEPSGTCALPGGMSMWSNRCTLMKCR